MNTCYLKHPIDYSKLTTIEPSVFALGFFDGVHLGHKRVIKTAQTIAKEKNIKLSVITFYPHPSQVIKKGKKVTSYLSPMIKKQELFEELGVDTLYVVHFDEVFSKLSPEGFVNQYLINLSCRHAVAGSDFTYGYKGEGTIQLLQNQTSIPFDVTIVSKIKQDHQEISSTLIRYRLSIGEVDSIPELLGEHYKIKGSLVPDNIRGNKRAINYLVIKENYLLPCEGKYEINLIVEGRVIKGIIRVRPSTFKRFSVIDILSLDRNLDNKDREVEVEWLSKINDQRVEWMTYLIKEFDLANSEYAFEFYG